jgi:peptide/nickel transport system ATP-binding protein
LALLEVTDLKVHFRTDDGVVKAVDGVSYTVEKGQAMGIVGESGSGKSVSSLSVMGLTRFSSNAEISGSIVFDGRDLLSASDEDMRKLRGNDMAMIFQDPLSSLHPFYKIGDQLVEAVRAHRDVSKAQALDRAVEMLGLVGIPEPRRRVDSYPHEFSGGMRQRVMIAMALINDPKLLIADEPTTALDVTVQAQILDLIQRLQHELDTAIVMITHDLGVVAEVTDEIAVMYAGRIVEYANKDAIFAAPEHPYTWGLLKSIPRLDSPRDEELVPIPGRPPSLILKPSGCAFHPRCPYVREAHTKIDPQLAPAAEAGNGGGHKHEVACLLPGATRRALWSALRTGQAPDEALQQVEVPDTAVDREAVGEVLAPAGTEVADGVVAEGIAAEPAPTAVDEEVLQRPEADGRTQTAGPDAPRR